MGAPRIIEMPQAAYNVNRNEITLTFLDDDGDQHKLAFPVEHLRSFLQVIINIISTQEVKRKGAESVVPLNVLERDGQAAHSLLRVWKNQNVRAARH